MGRLAMIMSMPVGKFVCRSVGVMWVMSRGEGCSNGRWTRGVVGWGISLASV